MDEQEIKKMSDLSQRVTDENEIAFYLGKPKEDSRLAACAICGGEDRVIALLCSSMAEQKHLENLLHKVVRRFDNNIDAIRAKEKEEKGKEGVSHSSKENAIRKIGAMLDEMRATAEKMEEVAKEL